MQESMQDVDLIESGRSSELDMFCRGGVLKYAQ